MSSEESKSIAEVVAECVAKYNHVQVCLTKGHGVESGENMWCVPCSDEDYRMISQGNVSEKFYVYLCNKPTSWTGVDIHSKIMATHNGPDRRPYARLYDNPGTDYNPIIEEVTQEQPLRFIHNMPKHVTKSGK